MSSDSHRRASTQHAIRESPRRDGFTLTELIVALMLLTVGLLALASTSAFLTYEHTAAGRAESAAIIAESRLEQLRVAGCTAGDGSGVTDGLRSAWSVVVSGHTAIATVTMSWLERDARVTQRYSTGYPCP